MSTAYWPSPVPQPHSAYGKLAPRRPLRIALRSQRERDGVKRVPIGLRRLAACLRRVRPGESFPTGERDTRIAGPTPAVSEWRALSDLAAGELVEWGGGKPRGVAQAPKVRGEPISDLVVEGRTRL